MWKFYGKLEIVLAGFKINQYLPVVDLYFTATFRHAIEKWQNQKFMIA